MYRLLLNLILVYPTTDVLGKRCNYEKYGPNHTMCIYKKMGCQGNLINRGINGADIKVILLVHNNYRNKVALGHQKGQPPASDMKELKWSDELSEIAQRWADQCTLAHDKNRLASSYLWVGQNLAITGLSLDIKRHKNFTKAIEMWYNEVINPGLNPKYIQSYVPNKSVQHYTQIVWSETDRIGCGFSYYKKKTSVFFYKLYVCNYGPGGNIDLMPIYEIGYPASKCRNKQSKHYKGLCRS